MSRSKKDNNEFVNWPSYIQVSVIHNISILFLSIWLLIIADLFNTDQEFKIAMRRLEAVGNEKGSFTSTGGEAYRLFNETGPGLSWVSPERNRRIKIKKPLQDWSYNDVMRQ